MWLGLFSSELFDSIIAELKNGFENGQFKEKKSKNLKLRKKKKERNQSGGQSRNVSLKNLLNKFLCLNWAIMM